MRRLGIAIISGWMLCASIAPAIAADSDEYVGVTQASDSPIHIALNTKRTGRVTAVQARLRANASLYASPDGTDIVGELPAGAVRVLDGPRYDRYFVASGAESGWTPASVIAWTLMGAPGEANILPLSALDARTASSIRAIQHQVNVAVYDPGTNRMYQGGASGPVAAASLSKALLATVALKQIEQGILAGSDELRELLAVMIRMSDNDAANEVWDIIGGRDGIAGVLAPAGLMGFDMREEWDWGAIAADAPAWARFFGLLGSGQLLDDANTAFMLDLMENVIPDHRWGVLTPGADRVSIGKNGWYLDEEPRPTWRVNSAGFVASRVREQRIAPLVVVVLTRYPGEYGRDWGVDIARIVAESAMVCHGAQRGDRNVLADGCNAQLDWRISLLA